MTTSAAATSPGSPAARRYFETALRASATAGDPVTGAYALSFGAPHSQLRVERSSA